MKNHTRNAPNPDGTVSTVASRSAVASALFDTGFGTPDDKISRSNRRFPTREAAGAAGGTGTAWSPAQSRIAPPVFPVQAQRSLKALVVPFGTDDQVRARLTRHDLREFDAVAVRLEGGDHLPAAIAIAAASAGECDPMVIVDAEWPLRRRHDVDLGSQRAYAVSVVPAEDASLAQYTLVPA